MTGASLVVRRGEPAEAARLTEIARAAKAHWGYPAAWLVAWEGDLTLTPEYVAANRVFVAERDALVVGVCALDAVRRVRPGVVMAAADPQAAGFYAHLGARPAGSIPAPAPGSPERTLPLFEFVVPPAW